MSDNGVGVPLKLFNTTRVKPGKAAIRIVTNGAINELDGCCVWSWEAISYNGKVIASREGKCTGDYGLTPNSAKFLAVIEALRWLTTEMPKKGVRVLCDGQVIVNVINGQYTARQPHLRQLLREARELLSQTKAIVEWIPHSRNRLGSLQAVPCESAPNAP